MKRQLVGPLLYLPPNRENLQKPVDCVTLYESTTPAVMARKKQGAEAVLDPVDSEMAPATLAPEIEETEAPEIGKTKVKGDKMTGQALLDYVAAHKEDPIEEVLFSTGYYTLVTDNETGESETRYHKPAFFKAMTEASTGYVPPSNRRSYTVRRGRQPVITVGKTGNCVVGNRHSSIAGFGPGSKVQVTAEEGKIVLTPYEGDADGVEEADDLDL